MSDRNDPADRNALALELLQSITSTAEQLFTLDDKDLDHECSHGCAMGGGIRRLLVHNAEHEIQHAGPISTARTNARDLQESEHARLVRVWLQERVALIGLLIGATDDLLDTPSGEGEWTVREHVEHVLYYERDSIEVAMREVRETQTARI